MKVKKSDLKKLIKETIKSSLSVTPGNNQTTGDNMKIDEGFFDDPIQISSVISSLYGSQPSIQDIVKFFATDYSGKPSKKLVQLILKRFQINNPRFFNVDTET